MWFRLDALQDRPFLAGLVGCDGEIYWRLVDIATFLQYKYPYNFHKKITRQARSVLPTTILPRNTIAMQSRIATTHEMIEFMRTKRRSANFKYACMLERFLVEGHVRPVPYAIDISYNDSPHLKGVSSSQGTKEEERVLFSDWLSGFVRFVLEYYQRLPPPPPPPTSSVTNEEEQQSSSSRLNNDAETRQEDEGENAVLNQDDSCLFDETSTTMMEGVEVAVNHESEGSNVMEIKFPFHRLPEKIVVSFGGAITAEYTTTPTTERIE